MNTDVRTVALVSEFDPADSVLIDRFASQSDQEAFTILRNRYHGMVYAVCRGYLGGYEGLVDDAVQAVFILLTRRAREVHGHGNLAGWLHVVARNVSRTIARSETRRRHREREAHDLRCEEATSETDGDQLASQLHEAIDELGSNDREAVVLHYFRRLPYESVARKMHCSEDSIKVRVSRARKRIRDILERKGVTVTMAAVAVLLEESVADQGACGGQLSTATSSATARSVASAVSAEMDREAARAMWWKVGGVAAGLATIGVGTALVANYLQPVQVPSDATTVWRIESVAGSPLARRGETVQTLKAGDVLYLGDTILTSSNEEIRAVSDDGDRILLREEGELNLGTGNAKLGTFEEGRARASSPRRGTVDVPFLLMRGAVVAKVKRPAQFTTPHAGVETDGADFFLIVANGMTTNATPWSFTRVDVTEGSLKLETGNSKPETGPPARSDNLTPDTRHLTPLELSSGQFAAVGTDMEGRTIAVKAGKSDCRELSPKHGGVFFREYAELYETKGAALDVLRFTEGRVLLETNAWQMTDKLMTRGGPKIAKKIVGRTGEPVLVIANGTSDVAWVSFPLGFPSVDAFQVTVQHTAVDVSYCYSLSVTSMGSLPIQNMGRVAMRTDSGNPIANAGVWDLFKIRLIRVGIAPGGRSIYETNIGFNGMYVLDPEKWGPAIIIERANVGIGAIRIEELRCARGDAGTTGARGP